MNKLIFAAVMLAACVPLAMAQGTYTQIDYPGATLTALSGIDNNGDIVGNFVGTTSRYQPSFVLSGGVYSKIAYPGVGITIARSINDSGQVVGYTISDGAQSIGGFIYDIATATFTTVSYPGQDREGRTYPYFINDSGTVVGSYTDPSTSVTFQLTGSTYTAVLPPTATYSNPYGITSSGEIFGRTLTDCFTFFNEEYKAYPCVSYHDLPLTITGVSPSGAALVGYFSAQGNGQTYGFVNQGGHSTVLNFPGSSITVATGINDSGEVVGWFLSNEQGHGFTWTPPAADEKK